MKNVNLLKIIDKIEYPFENRFIQLENNVIHYIDEGNSKTVEVILFIHGTPVWSYDWRKQIIELRNYARCIAIDHLGFGLSYKPIDGEYSVKAHSERLEQFINKLNLTNIHLVVHDFGGPIGLNWAINNIEKIKSITIGNSWAWSLNNIDHFSKKLKPFRTPIGKFLYENMGFSPKFIVPMSYGDKIKLGKQTHQMYIKQFKNKNERKSTYKFLLELTDASDFYDNINKNLNKLSHLPIDIYWGMKDRFIPAELLLDTWKTKLPNAKITQINEEGHFPHEENLEIINLILKSKIQYK